MIGAIFLSLELPLYNKQFLLVNEYDVDLVRFFE